MCRCRRQNIMVLSFVLYIYLPIGQWSVIVPGKAGKIFRKKKTIEFQSTTELTIVLYPFEQSVRVNWPASNQKKKLPIKKKPPTVVRHGGDQNVKRIWNNNGLPCLLGLSFARQWYYGKRVSFYVWESASFTMCRHLSPYLPFFSSRHRSIFFLLLSVG